MPREVLVDKGRVKARVVKFDDDITDEIEDVQTIARRTAEELEWMKFQMRWTIWKKKYGDPRVSDPSRLQVQIHG